MLEPSLYAQIKAIVRHEIKKASKNRSSKVGDLITLVELQHTHLQNLEKSLEKVEKSLDLLQGELSAAQERLETLY